RAGASGEAIALFTADETRYLQDIEKLTKRPVPRGTLDVPRDLVARSHTRDTRDGRDARGRGRERRGSSQAYGAPQQPVDDFFYKPYEPAAPAADQAEPKTESRSSTPKRQVAVLLGGSRKP